MSTAVDEKTEGQARTLGRLTEEQAEAFLDAVRAYPQGTRLSVNDMRSRLDHLAIPTTPRAALFRRAVDLELLVPLEVTVEGITVPVRVQSTGRSAHQAYVQVYERL